MLFTSLTFLLFLGIVFCLYWALPGRRVQNAVLLIASYVFYGWWDYRFLVLIFISSFIDYWVGLALGRTDRPRYLRRALLGISCLANLGLLGFFKYYNFFADSLQAAFASLGVTLDTVTLSIVLPVGISFYTFQTLSYTLDIYYGKLKPTTSWVDFFTFVAFFPQLVAGPIERAAHMLPQFANHRVFSYQQAAEGCRQILWGFFKKMAIANYAGLYVDECFSQVEDCSGGQLALAVIFFAFQIYGDFSGYSDIAIGTGKLFGFQLMRNFAYPYFSRSIPEFWRRWHISLSTWFRDYVFIPFGGNRGRFQAIALRILLVFVISGLWHGAAWNFIIWGFLNGLALLPFYAWPRQLRSRTKATSETIPGGSGLLPRPQVLLQIVATFAWTCLTWVFFRATTFSEAILVLKKIAASLFPIGTKTVALDVRNDPEKIMPLIILLIIVEWISRRYEHPLQMRSWPRFARWTVYTVLILLSFYFFPVDPSPFIYFQF